MLRRLVLKVRNSNTRLTVELTGVSDLREAVANLYNHTYRQGKASQYTHENVCIVPGGRAGLSRVAAVVGDVYCVGAIIRVCCFTSPVCSRTKFLIILLMIKC